MLDVMIMLKDRRAKAESKVARALKALESARNELADLIAAQRVMAGITGESIESKTLSGQASERDRELLRLLGVGTDGAKSPIDLHPIYVQASGDNLNLDAFRTALWRLQKKIVQAEDGSWVVKSDSGRYWREPADDLAEDYDEFPG